MKFKPTATLEPSMIKLLRKNPAYRVLIEHGWITIIRIKSASHRNTTDCIPETIESVQTLQYLGLTHKAALKAFAVFALQCELNVDFVEWAKRHVEKFPDCLEEDDVAKWDEVMRVMGVQELRREAILDPRYAELRQEHTAKYWVVQTMEEKWKYLVEFNQRLKSDMVDSRQ